jgi:hypothetical protein
MSKKNVKKKSLPGDPYYTPNWVVRQCCEHVLPIVCPNPVSILEPAAGGGEFVRGVAAQFPDAVLHAVDRDSSLAGWPAATESYTADFLSWTSPIVSPDEHDHPYDLIVGNPPYSDAMAFVERSMMLGNVVVLLLRQGFMSSQRRSAFFHEHPPTDVFILAHRPSFTGDNHTDAADYCFISWDVRLTEPGYPTRLRWLPTISKEQRRGQAA